MVTWLRQDFLLFTDQISQIRLDMERGMVSLESVQKLYLQIANFYFFLNKVYVYIQKMRFDEYLAANTCCLEKTVCETKNKSHWPNY